MRRKTRRQRGGGNIERELIENEPKCQIVIKGKKIVYYDVRDRLKRFRMQISNELLQNKDFQQTLDDVLSLNKSNCDRYVKILLYRYVKDLYNDGYVNDPKLNNYIAENGMNYTPLGSKPY